MKSLFDNLALKIVALILGLLLWFHVATEKVYTYQVRLPLSIVNLGQDLALGRFPTDSLTVVVSANGKRLGRTGWREAGVRINALQFPAGRHLLTLTPGNTTLIGGSNLISLDEVVTPSSLELYIDRRSEVNLPVRADLIAIPDNGFAVASISKPDPDQVKVMGPRSLLGGFSTIFTEHRRITGLRNSLDIHLPLTPPAGYGIRLDPDSVTLSIQVVPVRTRLFEGVPVVLYNLPPDIQATARPGRISIVVTGPPDAIDSLESSALIASADFAAMDSFGRTAIKVDCPATFLVKSVSVDSVTIGGL